MRMCRDCGLSDKIVAEIEATGGMSRCTRSITGHHLFLSEPSKLSQSSLSQSSGLPNNQVSVLQDWVMRLPLREQGTLLTAVRGCDDEPKIWIARGVAESPGRRLTAFIRWCFMNPADPREVDVQGAFFQSTPPQNFKPSGFGHLPQHWYAHAMHALEVCAYRHPTSFVAEMCLDLYERMVHNLHLNVETKEQFIARLSEDRIASGEVVS